MAFSSSFSSSSSSSSSSPSSARDLQLLYDSDHSNLQCFIQSITPTLPTQFHSHFQLHDEGTRLSEIWNLYTEWSFYGAAVPVLLNNVTLQSVVQYYCPSLSALQIFTDQPYYSCTTASNGTIPLQVDDQSSISSSTSSYDSDDFLPLFEFSRIDSFGYLYCEYCETSTPYDRIPLMQKINELAEDYEGLNNLCSADLSPYSWMAIAWHPIYQIPVVSNIKELSACFVTYHTLSTNSSGQTEGESSESCLLEEDEVNRLQGSRGEFSLAPFAMVSHNMSGDTLWLNPETSDEETMISHQNAASSWLRHLNFLHHDFNLLSSNTI